MRRGRVPELGILLLGFQIFRNVGVANIPPVTLLTILLQVGVYMQMLVLPRLCLSGEGVWYQGEYLRLLVPALRHSHDIHLYYNMVSLAWKGIALERRFGSFRFFITLVVLTLMSSTAYVALAMFAADLLEDYSYMQQCAVGFSGVLFAMKVLTTHYDLDPNERAAYFGFLLPVRWAVWAELLLIQLMVPNASFIGHLGGILAGLVFLYGPLGGLLSMAQAFSYRSLLPGNPGTWLVSGVLTCLHTGHFLPWRLAGCLPTRHHQTSGFSVSGLESALLAPFYHLGLFHLGVNLVSLHVKSWRLEQRAAGSLAYMISLATAVLTTSLVHVVLVRVAGELTGSQVSLDPCVVGLSGPLFALKVLVILRSDSFDLLMVYELVELGVLYEKNTRLYHLAGLLAGLLIHAWSRHYWPTPGHRLGSGGAAYMSPSSYSYPRRQPPPATRSWGYGPQNRSNDTFSDETEYSATDTNPHANYDEDPELAEAIRRSYASFRAETGSERFTPTAPPHEEEEDGENFQRYPDLVGQRPPLYPANPGPPPPGGWRLPHQPRGLDSEELRRRRIERFS